MIRQAKIHVVLQLLDLVLTYIGCTLHGTSLEGNPLMHYLIQELGLVPALLLAKTIAIAIILHIIYNKVIFDDKLMKYMLVFVNILYAYGAIFRWSVFLLTN